MRKVSLACIVIVMVAMIGQARTIAHWDFNDPALGAADGVIMPNSEGRTVWREATTDKSGNGNHLTTWDEFGAAMQWSTNTSDSFGFSMINTGNYPAVFTWSDQSMPTGTDVELLASAAFTIEAQFNADVVGGAWRTLVGRDGQGLVAGSITNTHEFDLPALALSITPDIRVALQYTDAAGVLHYTASAPSIVTSNQWYHLAAVSDGTTLVLSLNGSVVSSLNLAGTSADTSLNNALGGVAGNNFWKEGGWTIARGMYGGGHADRFLGYVDGVAISDKALTPWSFVIAPMSNQAHTIAHWDFNDPALGAADGVAMPDSDGRIIWREAATDKSGNGNHLTTWDHSFAGFDWSTDTSVGYGFSLKNAGDFPAAFTWSAQSTPGGTDLELFESPVFTVETRFNADIVGDVWHTLVGRDGMGLASSVPNTHEHNLSAFALSIDANAAVVVHYVDVAGVIHFTGSTPGIVTTNQWYHLAAVSDGNTLSLYLDEAMVASLDMTGSSTNTALNNALGGVGGGDWAGAWSVSRGMYAGGHNDRFYGYVDGVAISDVALAPWASALEEPTPIVSYENWAMSWDVDIGAATDNYDGDQLNNLYEYGLGGDPTNALDIGFVTVFDNNGTSLGYIHAQRTDDNTLNYYLETTTDLVNGSWTNDGYSVAGTNVTGSTFDFVTNTIPTVENYKFIRLIIE